MGADSSDSIFSISRCRGSGDDDSPSLPEVGVTYFFKYIFY